MPQHDDFQLLEIIRLNVQGSELQNPTDYQVTERDEHKGLAPILGVGSLSFSRRTLAAPVLLNLCTLHAPNVAGEGNSTLLDRAGFALEQIVPTPSPLSIVVGRPIA